MEHYDVIVIGAGILGSMVARELSRYQLKILVLEKAYDVGEGATKANSGVLYAGFHARGDSLKGISCVQGNAQFPRLCKQLQIPMKSTGSLFVAFHEAGKEKLQDKMRKGIQNGVPNMEMINGDEARRMESALSKNVRYAMYAPTTGIISPFQLILAVAKSANRNGVDFQFNTSALGLVQEKNEYIVHTNHGDICGKYLVNAAGEEASILESYLNPTDLLIKPKRGQFYVFDRQLNVAVNHVLYQVQEENEGGTFIAPTIEGNLLIGPTSEDVKSFRCNETTAIGLAHLEKVAKKILPDINMDQVITSFSGIRTNIKNIDKEQKDFIIRVSAPRMVSALGIKTPGMTASPYLATQIVMLLQKEGLSQAENKSFDPCLPSSAPFIERSLEEKQRLFQMNPAYGHVICRCENITEGDVLHMLKDPLPPQTLNGFKKRLRIGMGRCQGAFCTPRMVHILSRELGIPADKILKSTRGSAIVKGSVK